MGALLSFHEISTLGLSVTKAFSTAAVSLQLAQETSPSYPMTFLIRADQDCYVRQGGASVNADNPATSGDSFELKADEVIRITVLDENSNYLSILRVDTDGTLKATRNSGKTPGTDPA